MAMELNKLFRSLELKTGNPDEKIEGYLIAIAGATYHAMQTTVARIIRGEIDGISKKFCPTPPELAAAIRDEMAFVKRQIEIAQERLRIDDNRPVAVRPLLYAEKAQALRDRMRDERRALIFSVTSHDDFLRRRKEMQPGYEYHALLGECYGAPGSADAVAAVAPVAGYVSEQTSASEESPVAAMTEPVTDDVAW